MAGRMKKELGEIETPTQRTVNKRRRIVDSSDDNDSDEDYKPKEEKAPAKTTKAVKRKANAEPKPASNRKANVKRVKLEENDNEAGSSKQDFSAERKQPKCDLGDEKVLWDAAVVLSYSQQVSVDVAHNVTQLLDEDNTVPFIARYRRGLTNNMEAEQLREFKHAYEQLKLVATKAKTLLRQIVQADKLTPAVKVAVLTCQTLSELEHVGAPYKTGSKRTLAERARALGLEEPATQLLTGSHFVDIQKLIKPDTEGLETLQQVETGLQHIIADIVSKNPKVLAEIRDLKGKEYLTLESHKARQTKTTEKSAAKTNNKAKSATGKPTDKSKGKSSEVDENKFADYFKFSVPVRYAKPHQVLALNRGEKLKMLSVKIETPDSFWHKFERFCLHLYLSQGMQSPLRTSMCKRGFQDAWQRLLQPLVCRQVRAELMQEAEKAGLEVFADNLKNLLLIPPLKGCVVLGIDPGFRHGCKLAVVNASGELLQTAVINPRFGQEATSDPAARTLGELMRHCSCEVVGLGNGTACRETETWLGALISAKWFAPLNVKYTVVSEQGASIYSCSTEAKEEFPKLDPNLISAVSIARRLQEPLAELVKVEPRHLGVGMYQHDLPDTRLRATLDEVVQQCVSFVGVDLNTASLYLLRRVAGLSDSRAKNILAWRAEEGGFICRQQLLKVKGIGAKTFEQCAGFVRIMSTSSECSSKLPKAKKKSEYTYMPLDNTNVHPESYKAANMLLKLCGATLQELGQDKFISSVKSYVEKCGAASLVDKLKVANEQAVAQLVEALTQGLAYDPRARLKGPIFRKGVTTMDEITPGSELSGCVQNVTHFGAFIDIGVGTNGLVHTSAMNGIRLALGNRVSVKVKNVDVGRRRIGLELLSVLS